MTTPSAKASASARGNGGASNPDKTRAQKRKGRSANYHRPFVAIDSEGQNYPDDDILYDGVRHPKHETYLWGAAADDGRPPIWLMAAGTHGLDKLPLDAVEILDWLLSSRASSGQRSSQFFVRVRYLANSQTPSL